MRRFQTALLVATAFAASSAQAYVDKPLPDRDGARALTCRECHTHKVELANAGTLTVEGLPAHYTPGQRYELTVRLAHPDLVRGGFEASIRNANGKQAGQVSADDPRLSVVADPASGVSFVHHTKRGTRTDDTSAAWTFTWTAPEKKIGAVTVRAAGNASNADDSPLGDVILFFSQTVGD